MGDKNKGLLHSILRWKVKRFQVKTKREVKFMDYESIHSVLLIFCSKDGKVNHKIDKIAETLEKDGKKVVLCGFVNQKQEKDVFPENTYMLDLTSLNIFKEPKSELIADLLKKSYDIVIDLTLTNCLPLQYLSAYANAPFKAGRKRTPGLDFMINVENLKTEKINEEIDECYLFEQVIFYLKAVKSNN